jgi:methionyl-tRNA formyltransferase
MAGDAMTGVTIIKLDEGLDTGPVLTAQAVDIAAHENAGTLTNRLSIMGARLLVSSIGPYLAGELVPTPQTDEGVTYADKIGPSDRPIDTSSSVLAVTNQVRGLAPTPAATLTIDGETHKVYDVAPADASPPQGLCKTINGVPVVGVADGGIQIRMLQPPGKRPMSGADWVRGRRTGQGTLT